MSTTRQIPFAKISALVNSKEVKMLLIGFSTYPQQSAKVCIKRMMELPRLPDYIKSKGFYAYSMDNGITSLAIYEFDGSKADEALQEITTAYWRFHDVPGHNFKLIPCAKARESAQRFLELF
jgi:hypothetical protein